MSISVLIVEDHPVVRSGIRMLLTEEGDIEVLAELVSIGTLAIFGSVCAGLLVWRHARVGESHGGVEGLRAERIAATSRAATPDCSIFR